MMGQSDQLIDQITEIRGAMLLFTLALERALEQPLTTPYLNLLLSFAVTFWKEMDEQLQNMENSTA
jgi:hypothetical protein